VVLTEDGLRTVDAAVTTHVTNEERLLSGLTKTQRRALDDALRALLPSSSTCPRRRTTERVPNGV
jgi:hypothetical protein